METRDMLKYRDTKFFTQCGIKYKVDVYVNLESISSNKMHCFSTTYSEYRKAKNGRWVFTASGPCGEKEAKMFPELAAIFELNRVNHYGEGDVTNAVFWIRKGEDEFAKKCLRITDEEYHDFRLAALLDDTIYFRYLLLEKGIIERWKNEADYAISQLEYLCNCKWVNPYTPEEERFRLNMPTTEELRALEEKLNEGYYTKDAILARIQAKRDEERAERRKYLIESYDKKRKNLEIERQVMLAVFDFGIDTSNVIYYSYSNKLVFNWSTYSDKVSQEQFVDFVNNVDMSKMPEGIQFEIK